MEKTSPIYLAKVTVESVKPKKGAAPKWKKKSIELVYKKRREDDNDDSYLIERLRTYLKINETTKFKISKVEKIKYITEGKFEYERQDT